MRLALNALFVLWCLALLVTGLASFVAARGLSAEAGGTVALGLSLLCAFLLAISVALRVLL